MKKLLLVVLIMVCSTYFVSAQVFQKIDWTPRYKSEVNAGFAVTGSSFNASYKYTDSEGNTEEGNYNEKVNTVISRPFIETIHGVEFAPYFFVGAGLGLQYYCGKLKDLEGDAEIAAAIKEKSKAAKRWNALMIPLFANIRFKYPLMNGDLEPFVNLGLGGTIGVCSSVNYKYSEEGIEGKHRANGGFYCDFGAGVRYKKVTASIGLQHQDLGLTYKYKSEDYSSKSKDKIKSNAFYIKVGYCF